MFDRGMVVRSRKGRDKGRFYVVSEVKDRVLTLTDGVRTKRKNPVHLAPTRTVLDMSVCGSDKEIIEILSRFRDRTDPQREVI